MHSVHLRPLAFLLFAGASCISAAKPAKTDSVKPRLVVMLREAGLYQPPEIPTGCLDWSGAPKGDSVLFRPVMSGTPSCSGIDPVEDVWIVPRGGGTALLVEGADRTDLRSLTGADVGGSRNGDGVELLDKLTTKLVLKEEGHLLAEDVDPSEPNMIDVILAGGGGSIKKRELVSPEPQRTPGAKAGFGIGEAPRAPAAERARIAPPKASDIEISGEGAQSRSPESILRVIRQNVGSFRYTYQKYLRDDPGLGGEISLKFTIAPSGDIIALSLASSNTGNADLDDEIKVKARRMKFDEVDGSNLTVTYHFTLDRE